jgi:phospho-N-acetylmuramoyl-pentapeptide-transferase
VNALTAPLSLCVASLIATLGAGSPLIAMLKRVSYRQQAYSDAPKTHAVKSGTPTMGGLLFIIPLVFAVAIGWNDPATIAVAVLALLCGAIGAIDDLAKVQGRKTRGNVGLRGRVKFLLTLGASVVFLGILDAFGGVVRDAIFVPFAGFFGVAQPVRVPHLLWLALSVFVVLGTTHAVNLTDGLDGLAAGTIVPPLIALTVVPWLAGTPNVAGIALATAGAAVGFLVYNRYPAKVFMGDTGALLLGGVLAGVSIVSGMQLVLAIAGAVFVAEALSVIIQVVSFKTRQKRVFRMSPLHHHFELGGWAETKVTSRFWLASALLSVLAAASVWPHS